MRIKSVRIINYKGFADSGEIPLGTNWTIVVGGNNAGKTAFLEGLALGRLTEKPHRNLNQDPFAPRDPHSRIEVTAELAGKDLEKRILGTNGDIYVPLPLNATDALSFLKQMLFGGQLSVSLSRGTHSGWNSNFPSHGLFNRHGNPSSARIKATPTLQSWNVLEIAGGESDSLAPIIGDTLQSNTYVFRAERRVPGTSGVSGNLILEADASNLPGALHYLYTSNPRQFARFLELVKRVVPNIEAVTFLPSGSNVQVRIWNSGYEAERSDLAIPLEECGTGIGQLLAILYVAITSTSGRTIVIDEPNSFLHPGASRILMQLLRRFDQHQFVISTHSPEIISAVVPDELIVVRWLDGRSHLTIYDGSTVAGMRGAFNELGIRLSDVFGYDAIAWVEGPTEAACFPQLLGASGIELPPQAAFVPLVNTGDFGSSDAETVWRAYKQLAEQSSFVPRAICISLDRESRTEAEMADLSKRSNGLIRFLPRRTYENYLLHPAAIAAVLHQEDAECGVSEEQVRNWIDDHHVDSKYYSRSQSQNTIESDWRDIVHAPRLLHDLIGDLTEQKQDFKGRKIKYSSAITEWIIKNDREYLARLIAYVSALVARDSGE